MKMTLSTPSTISRNVRVMSATRPEKVKNVPIMTALLGTELHVRLGLPHLKTHPDIKKIRNVHLDAHCHYHSTTKCSSALGAGIRFKIVVFVHISVCIVGNLHQNCARRRGYIDIRKFIDLVKALLISTWLARSRGTRRPRSRASARNSPSSGATDIVRSTQLQEFQGRTTAWTSCRAVRDSQ